MGVRGLHGMNDDSNKINSEMCIFCGNKRLCRSIIEPCSYINLIGVKGEEGIPGLNGSKGKQGISVVYMEGAMHWQIRQNSKSSWNLMVNMYISQIFI